MNSRSTPIKRMSAAVGLPAIALLGLSMNALAEDAGAKSDNLFAPQMYGDSYSVAVANAPGIAQSIRVSGPNGFHAESRSLAISSSKPLADGLYNYEITGALPNNDAVWDASTNRENGRSEDARPGKAYGVIATGNFRIVNGTLFEPGNETEERPSGGPRPQPAERLQHDLR